MGDWNAKLGINPYPTGNIGPYGSGVINKSGEKLIKFTISNNLKVAASFYKKRKNKRWTWISPDKYTKNEIDHLLTNDMRIVSNHSVLSSFDFSSDHRLCRGTIKIPKRAKIRNFVTKDKKEGIGCSNLVVPVSQVQASKQFLEEQLIKIGGDGDLDFQLRYDKLCEAIEVTISKFGKKAKDIKTEDKLSTETKKLLKLRQTLAKKNTKSPREKIELGEINKAIRKAIRKDTQEFDEKVIIQTLFDTSSTKKANKVLHHNQNLIVAMQDSNDREVYHRDRIIKVVSEYYANLYKSSNINHTGGGGRPWTPTDDTPPILVEEVRTVLQKLKANKCPGPDNIRNEWLKQYAEIIAEPLTNLFNEILDKSVIPQQLSLIHISEPTRPY